MSDSPILESEPLRSRQALAAYYVQWAEHILEVGGGANPITDYLLRAPRSVTVVDPVTEPRKADSWRGLPCRVRHLRLRVEDYRPDGRLDALVMLGFEGFGHVDRGAVVRLLALARWVVIEASAGHAPAQRSIGALLAAPGLWRDGRYAVLAHLLMACEGAGVPPGYRFARREFWALKAGEAA
jgi:hypothetical protein